MPVADAVAFPFKTGLPIPVAPRWVRACGTLLCRAGCALGREEGEMLWASAGCSHCWCWDRSHRFASDQVVSGAGCDGLHNTGIQDSNEKCCSGRELQLKWKLELREFSSFRKCLYTIYLSTSRYRAQMKGGVSHWLIQDKQQRAIAWSCYPDVLVGQLVQEQDVNGDVQCPLTWQFQWT